MALKGRCWKAIYSLKTLKCFCLTVCFWWLHLVIVRGRNYKNILLFVSSYWTLIFLGNKKILNIDGCRLANVILVFLLKNRPALLLVIRANGQWLHHHLSSLSDVQIYLQHSAANTRPCEIREWMYNCAKAMQNKCSKCKPARAFNSGVTRVGAGYRYLISSSAANICCRNNAATDAASQILGPHKKLVFKMVFSVQEDKLNTWKL